jgi:DNA-binding MarR family transcriptional regulator
MRVGVILLQQTRENRADLTDIEAQMAIKSNTAEQLAPGRSAGLKPLYLEAVTRVERLHRRLLDLIKDEFDRMGWDDINPVQALLMFNIGSAELTAGELRSRGYYLGSNVSYNLKKLVETGYIFQERSRADRRSVRIRLTPKGEEVAEVIDELYDRHLKSIDKVGGLGDDEFDGLNKALARLERFWVDQILYKM